MKYGYGIQKLDKSVNKIAFDQKKLFIHFENLESINLDDYKNPGKKALKTLHNFCNKGALVALDYSKIDKSALYLGEIKIGTEIELEKIGDKWYKSVKLTDVKRKTYSDYPLLNIKPIKQTVCRWRVLGYRLRCIYEGKELPIEVNSLIDKQLEVICSEFLIKIPVSFM